MTPKSETVKQALRRERKAEQRAERKARRREQCDVGARTTDPLTSHEAANEKGSRTRTRDAIEMLAWQAGVNGITINECATAMPQHKAWSLSPLFAPLVRRGVLLRNVIGFIEPCKRWPHGKEVFETRIDPETKKRCIVHYHHAFARKKSPESDKRLTPLNAQKL